MHTGIDPHAIQARNQNREKTRRKEPKKEGNAFQDVEDLGRKLGYTSSLGNFHNISLGQGQEVIAEEALETAAVQGHWVILQVSPRPSLPPHIPPHTPLHYLSSAEHPPGEELAASPGEEAGEVRREESSQLPRVRLRRACPEPGLPHHSSGTIHIYIIYM